VEQVRPVRRQRGADPPGRADLAAAPAGSQAAKEQAMTAWIRALAARFRRTPDDAFIAIALAVVALVAGVAFSASYQHQYELDIFYRQTHWVAALLPLTVDGLIVAAGLVIWYAARHGYGRPLGAYLALFAGVGATVVTNLAADQRYHWPWVGPGISVWPAAAFVAAYEMAVWLVRKRQDATRRAQDGGAVSAPVPTGAENAALMALRATLAAGNPYSANQLADKFSLTRAQVTKVREQVLAGSNGHADTLA
jgi:hypothetical protein